MPKLVQTIAPPIPFPVFNPLYPQGNLSVYQPSITDASRTLLISLVCVFSCAGCAHITFSSFHFLPAREREVGARDLELNPTQLFIAADRPFSIIYHIAAAAETYFITFSSGGRGQTMTEGGNFVSHKKGLMSVPSDRMRMLRSQVETRV